MNFPIAVQLYSIRDAMEQDFEGSLRKIKAMGFDGVEFAGLHGRSPEEVRSLLGEIGLEPVSAHVPYETLMEDVEKVIGDYSAIGCKYIAIPYLLEEHRPGAEGFAALIKNAATIGAAAHAKGMTLLYHNHDFEFQLVNGEYALDVLYNSVPADYLQTEIDTCWVKVAGVDPASYILKYPGRSPVVHLKDFFKSGEKGGAVYKLIGIDEEEAASEEESVFEYRPLGKGLQDIPSILDASEKVGASWVVVEQDEPSMGLTSLECVETSIAYLKSL